MELKKMYPPQKDSPSTFILGDIAPTDVLVTVASSTVFPQVLPFPLTIGIDKTQTETVMVTEINAINNQLKIVRGEPAFTWPAGSKVARVLNAADLAVVQENLETAAVGITKLERDISGVTAAKLDKKSTPNSSYTTDAAGEQTMTPVTYAATASTIAKRTSSGALVASPPAAENEVTTKKFVEDLTDPLNIDKVNRTELPQVITDWTYSPDGTKLLVTITRYNASNKTTTTFTKIIPAVSDTTIGVMTPEAYNEITALRTAVTALQQQGGRFIGVSFATKAKLDAYVIPAETNQGDFTYVLDDETHKLGTTRYIYNSVSKKFEFAYVMESDPIGLANSDQAGVVKGNAIASPFVSRVSAVNNKWTSVCYGNGLFVAVANTGTGNRVMTSPDGITWTVRTSAANNQWTSVCYGNGLFVAVANNSVMTSPDGITWTVRTSAANNQWTSVCYGNGLFVAVANTGTGNRVMTSPDGITWTVRTSAANNQWTSVCYGNGLFVAVANDASTSTVMVSSDGVSWVVGVSAAANQWSSICHANGLFVAVAYSGTDNRVMTMVAPPVGKIYVESDGTMSVIGWDSLTMFVENAIPDLQNDVVTLDLKTEGAVNDLQANIGDLGLTLERSLVEVYQAIKNIGTINDSKITFIQNGKAIGSFTLNQNTAGEIAITTEVSGGSETQLPPDINVTTRSNTHKAKGEVREVIFSDAPDFEGAPQIVAKVLAGRLLVNILTRTATGFSYEIVAPVVKKETKTVYTAVTSGGPVTSATTYISEVTQGWAVFAEECEILWIAVYDDNN